MVVGEFCDRYDVERVCFNTLRKGILEVESKCSYCLLCMTLTRVGLRDKFA